MSGNSTTANVLMNGTGQAAMITGSAVSGGAVLYLVKYVTTLGTTTLEYLPIMLSSTSDVGLTDYFSQNLGFGFGSVTKLGLVLLGGIAVRTLGSALSSSENIGRVERLLYGRSGTNVNATDRTE